MLDPDSINALLAGLTTLAAVVITSLRKREDTTIEELRRRVADLTTERDNAIKRAERAEAVLATHSIPHDPNHLEDA